MAGSLLNDSRKKETALKSNGSERQVKQSDELEEILAKKFLVRCPASAPPPRLSLSLADSTFL